MNDHPTAGDYAYAYASDASKASAANGRKIADLEARLTVVENILRDQGLLAELPLDPKPWYWQGNKYGSEESAEILFVRRFRPSPGFEQRIEKYEGDTNE